MDVNNIPKVGVGVMVLKEGKVLLSKRKGSHGEGEWSFPGGHLEYMESFEDCAKRETLEECGVKIGNIRWQFLANVTKYSPKHYVHVGLIADWQEGEPQVLEPHKAELWQWVSLDDLPQPMFYMCQLSFECLKNGQKYFDINQE